jgi:hypothetical protein
VLGRVDEDHHAVAGDVLGHEFEDRAVRRAEPFGVAVGGFDVLEAAEGVEAVFGVVVNGRLVAQTPPDRMGIVLQSVVEGIPAQIVGLAGGHLGGGGRGGHRSS